MYPTPIGQAPLSSSQMGMNNNQLVLQNPSMSLQSSSISSTTSGSGIMTMVHPPTDLSPPPRPDFGQEGRPIKLRANHFAIRVPLMSIQHYDVNIQPDKCPKRVNREIINTMIEKFAKLFNHQQPVFDGKRNLYTRDLLSFGKEKIEVDVTLPGPGEGRDRLFKVQIRWVALVSFFRLNDALQGKSTAVSSEAVTALDVILRHLPSMK